MHAPTDGARYKCLRGGSTENASVSAVTGANVDGYCGATGAVEGTREDLLVGSSLLVVRLNVVRRALGRRLVIGVLGLLLWRI